MKDRILSKIEELKEEYHSVLGIRFETKERKLGEKVTDISKELFDSREFPEYESKEYASLKDLDGISTWLVYDFNDDTEGLWSWEKILSEIKASSENVYLIAGDDCGMGEDPNEQVISGGVVVDVLK